MKITNRVVFILFLVFLGIYFAGKNGYYETKLNQQKEMTEEQIMQFEEDVKNNVELDLQKYLPEEQDNSNFLSRGAYNISQFLATLLNERCKEVWALIKTLFIT